MLGQPLVADRLEQALQLSVADETEILLMAQDSALTRFANNYIHQNVAESNATVTVRAVAGQRVGSATTNVLSDEGLAKAAERALAHARQQPEDPDFPGLPKPKRVVPVEAFDQSTAGFGPESRAGAVGQVCRLARDQGLNAFGAFRTASAELAVANSHGLMVYDVTTSADFQATVSGDNGSGRAQSSAWEVGRIDTDEVGREAVDKSLRAQNPQPIEPGEYTVVLDPYAVSDIVMMLSYTGVSAQAVQEGRSWMNDRIGEQVMSPLVSIWDDSRDPTGMPRSFDFEGLPCQHVPIVDKGTVGGPVYDNYTAHKDNRESTGHAIPPGMSFFSGPLAMNLFMGSGHSSVEEMIRSTERGLYVTRFWYTRPVHPRDCITTGMTRDGVFLIENGRLTAPVKDLRFTQSYVQALADVQAVGREQKTLFSEFGGAIRVPALKIAGFNFTGRTA